MKNKSNNKTTEYNKQETEQKPPLGLMPRKLWNEQRYNDICSAMSRYNDCGKQIPNEWIEEYNELTKQFELNQSI